MPPLCCMLMLKSRNANAGSDIARVLAAELDYAFDKQSWHGANLMGSLRGVSPAAAAARLAGRKSIWEQLLHASYWKHRVLKKLIGARQGPLGRKGTNWLAAPADATHAAWRADVGLIKGLHERLRAQVASLRPVQLDRKTIWLIHGAAAHDVYHAGQIKLLRRLIP